MRVQPTPTSVLSTWLLLGAFALMLAAQALIRKLAAITTDPKLQENMAVDPNWLYSSVAQSSAAIVAIIGGFSTNALLSRASEREGLTARVREREREALVLRSELNEVDARMRQRRFRFAVEDHIDEILDLDPLPPADKAAAILQVGFLPRDELEEEWARTQEAITRERKAVAADLARYGFEESLFDEWVSGHRISLTGRDVWLAEPIYYHYARTRRRPGGSPGDVFAPEDFRKTIPPQSQWSIEQEYADRRREIEGYEVDISALDRRVSLAEIDRDLAAERLAALRRPKYLLVGIGILAWFSGLGMLLPFGLMPHDTNVPMTWEKWVVIGTFGAGLVFLLSYIVFLFLHWSASE